MEFTDSYQEQAALQHKDRWDKHRQEFEHARASMASYQQTRNEQFKVSELACCEASCDTCCEPMFGSSCCLAMNLCLAQPTVVLCSSR